MWHIPINNCNVYQFLGNGKRWRLLRVFRNFPVPGFPARHGDTPSSLDGKKIMEHPRIRWWLGAPPSQELHPINGHCLITWSACQSTARDTFDTTDDNSFYTSTGRWWSAQRWVASHLYFHPAKISNGCRIRRMIPDFRIETAGDFGRSQYPWLVVFSHPSEKYEFVNWDDDSNPIVMGKSNWWPPNHQPVTVFLIPSLAQELHSDSRGPKVAAPGVFFDPRCWGWHVHCRWSWGGGRCQAFKPWLLHCLLDGSSHVHRFCGLVHQSYLRGRLAPTDFPLTNHQGCFTHQHDERGMNHQVVAKSVQTLQVSWMPSFPFFK